MFFFVAFRSHRSTIIQTNEEKEKWFLEMIFFHLYIQRDFIFHIDEVMLHNATSTSLSFISIAILYFCSDRIQSKIKLKIRSN